MFTLSHIGSVCRVGWSTSGAERRAVAAYWVCESATSVAASANPTARRYGAPAPITTQRAHCTMHLRHRRCRMCAAPRHATSRALVAARRSRARGGACASVDLRGRVADVVGKLVGITGAPAIATGYNLTRNGTPKNTHDTITLKLYQLCPLVPRAIYT